MSGHVVGLQPNSNGPIRAKEHGFVSCVTVCCRTEHHKPSRKAEQLNLTPNFSVF